MHPLQPLSLRPLSLRLVRLGPGRSLITGLPAAPAGRVLRPRGMHRRTVAHPALQLRSLLVAPHAAACGKCAPGQVPWR